MEEIFYKDTIRRKPHGTRFWEATTAAMSVSTSWATKVAIAVYALALAAAMATVFVVAPSLANGVVSGKYLWFYGTVALTTLAALLCAGWLPVRFRFSLNDGLLATFCLCGIFITYINNNIFNTKAILIVLLYVLCLHFRILFTQKQVLLKLFIVCLIITGFVEALWGLQQVYGFSGSQHGLFVTTGSFFNPGPYAGYLAVVAPPALWLVLSSSSPHKIQAALRVFSGITLAAIAVTLPATMSRTAWIAAIAGCAVVVAGRYSIELKSFYCRHRRMAIGLLVTAVLAAVVFAAAIYRMKQGSADGRLLVWKISFHAMLHNPLGVGLNRFAGAYAERQADYFASGMASETEELVAGCPEYGFNEYLQIGVEWGMAPLALFLLLMFRCLRKGIRRKQWNIVGALTALLLFACGSYPFSVLPFLIALVLLMAGVETEPVPVPDNCVRQHHFSFRLYVLLIPLSLITAACLLDRYPSCAAYRSWHSAQWLYQSQDYEAARQSYARIAPQLGDQQLFLFEYGRLLSLRGEPEASNGALRKASHICGDPMIFNIMGKNYQAQKNYAEAEKFFLHAINIIPSRLYPWYLLTKLYAETGDTAKMRNAAECVLRKEPKVNSTAVREMREEVKKWWNENR